MSLRPQQPPFARPARVALPWAFAVLFLATALRAAEPDRPAPSNEPARPLRDGQDWPQFLGPHGTGVADPAGLLEEWPKDGPPVVGRSKICGLIGGTFHSLKRSFSILCATGCEGEPARLFRAPQPERTGVTDEEILGE